MNEHPDLDALSGFLDGEDTPGGGVRRHVQGCEPCRRQLDQLEVGRAAVASPVAPAPAAVREQAIARALAAAATGWSRDEIAATPSSPAPAPARPVAPVELASRRRWWLGGSAAAAVVAVVVGAVALVGHGSSSKQSDTALSAKAPSALSAPAAAGSAGGAGSEKATAGSDGVVDAGDLGDVPNLAALRSRVSGVTGPNAFASAPTPAAAPAVGNDSLSPTSPVPHQVGTRVCEVEARAARPQLGVVVYSATARFQGTPAQVLGFGPTPGGPPTALLVLAPQDGCRILAESTS